MRNPKIGKRGQSPVVPAYLDEVCMHDVKIIYYINIIVVVFYAR
jgi:hypothetical protein